MVIVWCIMLMILLGRACPELPAEVLFSDIEIAVLSAHAVKKTLAHPHNWERPYNLWPLLVGTWGARKIHLRGIR